MSMPARPARCRRSRVAPADDYVITGALTASVRADRDNGGDRIYTLNVGCTDRAGNLTWARLT